MTLIVFEINTPAHEKKEYIYRRARFLSRVFRMYSNRILRYDLFNFDQYYSYRICQLSTCTTIDNEGFISSFSLFSTRFPRLVQSRFSGFFSFFFLLLLSHPLPFVSNETNGFYKGIRLDYRLAFFSSSSSSLQLKRSMTRFDEFAYIDISFLLLFVLFS